MFSQKKVHTKVSQNTQAGLILGYEISKPIFKPVLEMASKGVKGWSKPIFIESLVYNPAPLILQDRWFFDKLAVGNALEMLKARGVVGTEKLGYVFNHSNRFEAVDIQDLIHSFDDVDLALGTMVRCRHRGFRDAIEPLEQTYGNYASPENYEFERMNAGIIRTLSSKYPKITLLDDSLRAPVYEYLGEEAYSLAEENRQQLDRVIQATNATHNPLIHSPKFESDWNPEEFVRIQRSKGAKQLREVVDKVRATANITDRQIEEYLSYSRSLAESLSPSRRTLYSAASFGGQALATLTFAAQPLFFIPSYLFTMVTGAQLFEEFRQFSEMDKLKWLKVAERMASWSKAEGNA